MSGSELKAEAARVGTIHEAIRAGLEWIGPHRPTAQAGLERELRRDVRRARALRDAAGRPVAVAVFGASQAGKSYLVSRLAAPQGQPLAVQFGAERLDFLRDVNPPGGQEATGLVTRFTIAAPAASAEQPIVLRLLSQIDVIKILANTFLEDFEFQDSARFSPERQQEHLAKVEAMAGPGPISGLDVDAMEDLQEYFATWFKDRLPISELTLHFWSQFTQLVPRVPVARRPEVFAPLWGGVAALTRCCAELLSALERLGFPADVHAGLDAVQPRETSIIDVRTLFTLGEPAQGTVALRPAAGGAPVAVARAVATALVTEIVVPLAAKPWDFFDHTDLLDFPGARTREQIPDPERFLGAKPDNLGRVFLRGKVSYLFQRYNAEQEISAMLLCVGPSNQEVQTLPKMVDEWIRLSAGDSPAARAGKPANIFLVLTKFDSEFEDKDGEDIASGQRWMTRLQASLTDFLGKAYPWPFEWTPDRPFDNLFWLRNPSVRFDAVFDYSSQDEAVEVGISPRAAARVTKKKEAYLASPIVLRHFLDPARAWDEALRPNDGGIEYLATALAPVCDPRLKASQIRMRALRLIEDATARLRPFFRGVDADERLRDATRRAGLIGRELVQCAQAQMLGPLLLNLMVDTDRVAAVHWRLQTDASTGMTAVGAVGGTQAYEDELGADFFGEGAVVADGPRDQHEQFAALAIEEWQIGMRALAENAELLSGMVLTAPMALELAGEIARAAERLKLRQTIAARLRSRAAYEGHANAMEAKQVAIVEEAINHFVYQLGWADVEEEKRPRVGRDARPIFRRRERPAVEVELPEQPAPFDVTFNIDWIFGLRGLMEQNATSDAGIDYDVAANTRLGTILKELSDARDAA